MQHDFVEKRLIGRKRVFFGGQILIDDAVTPIACHVKNVSSGGANIVMLSGNLLPDQFDLVISKTIERHHAVVTWSRGRELGVAYRPNAVSNKANHGNDGRVRWN